MDKNVEKIYNMPHNQLRKATCLKECIVRLEALQRRYTPIFDEDPIVNSLLEQMRPEYDAVIEMLRTREDAQAYLEDFLKE